MTTFNPHASWQDVVASAEPWQGQVQAALTQGVRAGWTPPPLWQQVLSAPPPWKALVDSALNQGVSPSPVGGVRPSASSPGGAYRSTFGSDAPGNG